MPLTSIAQESDEVDETFEYIPVPVEVKVGMTYSMLASPAVNNIGVEGEVSRVWFPEKRVSLLLGIGYAYQNYAIKNVEEFAENRVTIVEMKYKSQNIFLPLIARVNFGKKSSFSIEIGSVFNVIPYVHRSGKIIKKPTMNIVENKNVSDRANFDLADIMLHTGINVNIPVKKERAISIFARYRYGFNTLYEINETTKIQQSWLSVGVGFRLND